MTPFSRYLVVLTVLALPPSHRAIAQVAAPPPGPPLSPGGSAAMTSETTGTVARFTLAPKGELDGFILSDGTQVHVLPHLSAELAAVVKPGDAVRVRGYRSPALPLVVALAVSDAASGQSVVDNGPPPPGSAPPPVPPDMPAPGAQPASVQGRVQMPLYGPQGELNGALIDDGTIVRMGPREAYAAAALLRPGQPFTAQGWELTTGYGRVLEAQNIASAAAGPAQFAPPQGFGPLPPAPLLPAPVR